MKRIRLLAGTVALGSGLAMCASGYAVAAPKKSPLAPLFVRDHLSKRLPTPVVRPDGITLPQAAPDGGDILLYDSDPELIMERRPGTGRIVPLPEPAEGATASRLLRNPGGGVAERITCSYGPGSGFYRNYNPSLDKFLDLDFTYHKGETAYTRAEPYRRYGPRGVVAYRYKWGFISKNCLSG